MNVADGVYKLVELWGAERRRREDGGLGYRQSCLASLEPSSGRGQSMLPHGVNDLGDAFLMVDAVMAALNPLVAETVRLLYVDRFSQVQVARRHACTDRTVRNRLQEALIRLQDAWMLGEVDGGFYSVKKSA